MRVEVDYLSAVMVSINLLLLATSLVITHYVLSAGLARYLGLISALMVVVVLLFAEITPKTIGLHRASRVATLVAPPVEWLTRSLSWLVGILTAAANAFCRCLHIRPIHRRHFVTEEDIKFFALLGGQEGLLEEAEQEMIEEIIELPETTAGEIKVARTDMVAVSEEASLAEAVRVVLESGHSRIPVYRETLDEIAGVLHAKDLLQALLEGGAASLGSLLRPAIITPESKRVDELLREMRQKKSSLAIVVDEYGGVDGLVTVEDILEQIVGPVRNEHDAQAEEILFLSPTEATVDPKVRLDQVEDRLGITLPEGEYSTLAGFLLEELGHMPRRGEKVVYRGYTFVVEAAEAQRITRVRVLYPARQESGEEAEGESPSVGPEGRD